MLLIKTIREKYKLFSEQKNVQKGVFIMKNKKEKIIEIIMPNAKTMSFALSFVRW